ncbi:MAG: phosphoheptose isomerase [Candidatus Pelagadaptatus aseana]|uniref:SIS domain-containing protein n=1 Tax=Candidatus Pelagadaptatus aseana TaxID=3120508 RepID=UPI0039B22A3C
MEQRVITLFHESIEAKMQAGEYLAPLLADASEMIVHGLLNGGKLLIAGNGTSSANAQILATNLINRFDRERPSLPAMALSVDFALQSAISNDYSLNDVFAKQIRALGQPGDILILITTSGNPSNLIQAIAAAHDREMNVIALSGRDGGDISAILDNHDLELRVPVDSRARIHEIHLLSIFCLCDLIDQQLFGAAE